jgi:hypothetical protein
MSINLAIVKEAVRYGPLNVYCKQFFSDIEDLKPKMPGELNYQPAPTTSEIEEADQLLTEIQFLAARIKKELRNIDLDNTSQISKIHEQFPISNEPLREKVVS